MAKTLSIVIKCNTCGRIIDGYEIDKYHGCSEGMCGSQCGLAFLRYRDENGNYNDEIVTTKE